jgi:hypothetical protein
MPVPQNRFFASPPKEAYSGRKCCPSRPIADTSDEGARGKTFAESRPEMSATIFGEQSNSASAQTDATLFKPVM